MYTFPTSNVWVVAVWCVSNCGQVPQGNDTSLQLTIWLTGVCHFFLLTDIHCHHRTLKSLKKSFIIDCNKMSLIGMTYVYQAWPRHLQLCWVKRASASVYHGSLSPSLLMSSRQSWMTVSGADSTGWHHNLASNKRSIMKISQTSRGMIVVHCGIVYFATKICCLWGIEAC